MHRRQIELASTDRLDARLADLMDGAESTYEYEADHIEKELENRYYAKHPDDRVRQAMGNDIPAWD